MPEPYSQAEDNRLKELLNQRKSYLVCARIMVEEGFPHRGRNALIGRAARRGLAPEKMVKRPKTVPLPQAKTPPVPANAPPPKPAPSRQAAPPAVAVPTDVASPVSSTSVHIFEARADQCRFPLWPHRRVSPGELMICGAPVQPGKSWCDHCMTKVFSPPEARVRGPRPAAGR